MKDLKAVATEIGRRHGYDRADYCEAYGGNPRARLEVPLYLCEVARYYLAGYSAGLRRYRREQAAEAAEYARAHVGG